MKRKLLISSILFFLSAFLVINAQEYVSVGEKIKPNKAVSTQQLSDLANKGQTIQDIKVKGTVVDVCQVKGCWMTVKLDDNTAFRVTFKDYGFFVPKDIIGKEVVFQGDASIEEIPVKDLKHYAEDAGMSKEDIEKITEPKKELSFVAAGVLIEQ